jgi:hypothetical protein
LKGQCTKIFSFRVFPFNTGIKNGRGRNLPPVSTAECNTTACMLKKKEHQSLRDANIRKDTNISGNTGRRWDVNNSRT